MLSILMPLSSLLLLPSATKKYWHLCSSTLIMLSMYSLLTPTKSSIVAISNWVMLDSMSITLISLTLWITSLMFIASYKIMLDNNSPKMFSISSILLCLILNLCFSASSMISFYVWFEASLIPTMLLIMMWGYQPERLQASMYLMIYTVTASLPLLLGICMIFFWKNSMSMFLSMTTHITPQSPLFSLILMTAFLVKLPLFSVHLWLPKAHVEAPVAGSMVLAAILLKLGGYGIMRFSMMIPQMAMSLKPAILSLALTGAVFTSLMCLRQTDMKSLIAYSSIGHMGLMVAGVMTLTNWGMSGALAMMIAHGLCSSAMFSLANLTYEMTHTRSLTLSKGIMSVTPVLTMWWFLFSCINMAAPPSINLLSEIILMTSIMSASNTLAIPLAMTSFLTGAYSLILYSTINHGHIMSSCNPLPLMKNKDFLMLTMHMAPIILIMMKPELITMS